MKLRPGWRTAAAALISVAMLTGPAKATQAARSFGTDLRASLAGCGVVAACKSASLDGALAGLRSAVSSMPHGASGPAAWLRLAARIQGLNVSALAPLHASPRDAILALYRQAGIAIRATRVDAALAAVSPREAAAVGDLAGSLAIADRAAKDATRGSGLERIAKDPIRAMHLVTFVGSAATPAAPELRAEYDSMISALGRVNMPLMASAALTLADAIGRIDPKAFRDDVDLPLISIGHDGNTTYKDPLLLQVDTSGNDIYLNNAGGGVVYAGGALAVDLGGGSDTYSYDVGGQGWGLGAPGILYDDGGTDAYSDRQFGQGASVGGVGMLYDAGTGDEHYLSPGQDPISAKASSLGGIGVLVDEGGSDTMRQDGLDGFVYGAAGGLGLMANLGQGNDSYRSDEIPVSVLGAVEGTFAGPVQVSAEVGGTAILYEEGGSDIYTCGAHVRQGCQGAGGVGGTGLLWDLAGNDTYTMGDSVSTDVADTIGAGPSIPVFPMGQGSGYGPSAPAGPGLGILRDEGGTDTYVAARWAQGYATASGIGLLYDSGAATDVYQMKPPLVGARANDMQWFDGTGGFGIDG
jgi:hypothetical protein